MQPTPPLPRSAPPHRECSKPITTCCSQNSGRSVPSSGRTSVKEREYHPMSEFSTCMDENWSSNRVAEDLRAAQWAGLQWTPSIIVNGTLLPGTPDLEMLQTHVARALREMDEKTR
ncbi:MAG: thioredoxin domain-containing protein [Gammaproteobacteria bacterium]|nr:thioredoxin domain-containing protein [Gammaproteobacteria bacterium]MDE0258884.1 thioredoxin domain-containing protein [Gammaproteobacteria bacterium]